ncbi:MAG: sugar phosphate isomerase/epimerase [Anaerolineae bacterium]|nr:sugar phosphate isomerase/epimerase [Anaerolineae bacterium]
MKKGICHACFPDTVALDARLDLAQRAGFDGYELIVERPGEGELHADSTGADLRDIARRVAAHGMEICSMFGSPYTNQFPITSPDPELWERGIRALERMLEIANGLEVSTLLYVAGRVAEDMPYDTAYDRALEALRRVAPRAEELGVFICVENVGNRFLQSPLEMRDFILAAGSDHVRAYFDVGNVLHLGQGWPQQWLRILGPVLRQIHVKDVKIGPRGQAAVMLLQGDVDWPAVLSACREVGYDGYLVAEVGAYRHYPERTPFDISAAMDVMRDA